MQLAEHRCIEYARGGAAESWHFTSKSGETATVRPSGPLRTNNGDATLPMLRAGLALGLLPEFFIRTDLAAGTLEAVLTDWSLPAAGLHWVTPSRALRPKRVEILGDFLTEKLSANPAATPARVPSRRKR